MAAMTYHVETIYVMTYLYIVAALMCMWSLAFISCCLAIKTWAHWITIPTWHESVNHDRWFRSMGPTNGFWMGLADQQECYPVAMMQQTFLIGQYTWQSQNTLFTYTTTIWFLLCMYTCISVNSFLSCTCICFSKQLGYCSCVTILPMLIQRM